MGGLVYSTDAGRMCPSCRQPLAGCICSAKPARAAGDGVVRVSRETQGRKGKGVTVVRGLPGDDDALAEMARRLKALCGAGGTLKDGVVEVQGDHRDRIVEFLTAALRPAGVAVKRAGG
jgi:translation initiation factor 1